jgi:hypothetical protein
VICISLIIGISSFASSLEETWLLLGTGFGNYFENETDLTNIYTRSLGINFSSYSFRNRKNIGMFLITDFFSQQWIILKMDIFQ